MELLINILIQYEISKVPISFRLFDFFLQTIFEFIEI